MRNVDLKKHGDMLLFVLALVVVVTIFFSIRVNRTITKVIPSIVFTQWWEDDLEKNTLQDIINEFESLHKEIKIVLSSKPYEDLRLELFDSPETVFSGDVLALDTLWVPELQKKGIIENLWTESPPQQSFKVPLLSFVTILYYNTNVLKNAGFSRPPKSRSEFINYARAITNEEENRWGLALDENSSRWVYDDVYPWIWSAGTQLIKDGMPTVTSRSVIDVLSFLVSLKREGLVVPGNKLEDFTSGKAAFMISSAKDIGFVRNRMGDESFSISSVPLPDNYAGETYYGTTGWTIGINSTSAHKEEARLFADFLAGKALILSQKAGARPENLPSQDPFYSKVWDIFIAGEPAQEFSGLPWTEMERAFREELFSLFAEKTSPAETAAAIQERWSILAATPESVQCAQYRQKPLPQ